MNFVKKFLSVLVLTVVFGANAIAAVITWTFDDILFDRDGFNPSALRGSLSYDADTNTFSNSTLETVVAFNGIVPDFAIGNKVTVNNNSSTASFLSFSNVAFSSASLAFLTPLTNNGGTVFLTSGNLTTSSGSIWSLRNEQSISAPLTSAVPEPETYGMMLLGLGLITFVARRKQA
jgi:hypothetical protein